MNRRTLFGTAAALSTLAMPGILRAQAPAYTPNIRKLRISTGSALGNYHWSVVEDRVGFRSTLGTLFPEGVEAMPSEGSRDNVDRLLSGACDAAWVQEDVFLDATKTNPANRRLIPVFRVGYVEVLHILAAKVNGWNSLDDFAKAGGELGMSGGTVETWRIMTEMNPETKKRLEKINPAVVRVDYNRLVEVRDTRGQAQALVEGPGSDNSAVANNEVSLVNGKPSLTMLSVDASQWAGMKRADGEPLYPKVTLTPVLPVAKRGSDPGHSGFYNNLLPASGWISSGGIDTVGVRALLLMRTEYRDAISRQGDLSTRAGRAVDLTLQSLRKKVNPFNVPA